MTGRTVHADALDYIAVWREVYDALYSGPWGPLGEDFGGWDSTADGTPIPEAHMRMWRDTTVARLLELSPRHVAEIGVGGGLLLTALAPHVERYTGTELSAVAVEVLARRLPRERPDIASRVSLHHAPAHETDALRAAGPVDVVVLNSVIQYFPDLEYLDTVLAAAAEIAGAAGAVFVGDVRNATLQAHFARSVALARGASPDDSGGLDAAAARVAARDRELLVAPGWWADLARRRGLRAHVRCKAGPDDELTRYRYDVVLTGPRREIVDAADAPHVPADAAIGDAVSRAGAVRVVGIPNRRLTGNGPDPDRPVDAGPGTRTVVTWSTVADDALDVVVVDATLGPGVVVTDR